MSGRCPDKVHVRWEVGGKASYSILFTFLEAIKYIRHLLISINSSEYKLPKLFDEILLDLRVLFGGRFTSINRVKYL